VLNTAKGEEVVSVAWIADQGDEDSDDAATRVDTPAAEG
jgi:hypothetical protein